MASKLWYCYILRNDSCLSTYNGKTNDLVRRLRQHNGEIKGGAKATTRKSGIWEYIAILSGFPNEKTCLSCEWRIRYPTKKRPRPSKYHKPMGRINGLQYMMNDEIWTSKCPSQLLTNKMTLKIHKDYIDLFTFTHKNLTIDII